MSGDSDGWIGRVWDRHHVKAGWILVGLIVGSVLGMAVGSYASCSSKAAGCAVRWDAVTAIGTWFGALGGILAVGAAIATFRSGEQARLDQQLRMSMTAQQREQEALAAAARVTCRWAHYASDPGGKITTVIAKITNANTGVEVFNPVARLSGGRPAPAKKIAAGATQSTGPVPISAVAPPDRNAWLRGLAESTELTYTIDDTNWRRVGNADPERV